MSDTENNKENKVEEVETPTEDTHEKTTSETPKKDDTKKGMKIPTLKEAGEKIHIGPGNFWNNILSTVLLLIFVTAAYSYIVDRQVEPTELSVSEVVQQVKAGEVSEIIIRGSQLEVVYTDETRVHGTAKKERDAAITETLAALGVTSDQLNSVKIDVQNETGFTYWLGNVAPFLFPILFLGVVIWFFTRSV